VADSAIEWTDKVWNAVRGCSRVSPGCENCYAERQAIRMAGEGQPYHGLVRSGKNGPRWTGTVAFDVRKLVEPLSWRKPVRVFVNSMSDLFHEDVTDEQVAAVFGVMAAAPQHTYQVLTKRAERMAAWSTAPRARVSVRNALHALAMTGKLGERWKQGPLPEIPAWPLKNVWLGVSVEDQKRADERIPLLLQTPAAVRWLSVEPLLGRVDLRRWLDDPCNCMIPAQEGAGQHAANCATFKTPWCLDWVVVGGESGPGARPCALEWIEEVMAQCKAADVPVFVKQLGAYVVSEQRTADLADFPDFLATGAPAGKVWAWRAGLTDRKGADPAQWPTLLGVRQFPEARHG
jgi:protein gp37